MSSALPTRSRAVCWKFWKPVESVLRVCVRSTCWSELWAAARLACRFVWKLL